MLIMAPNHAIKQEAPASPPPLASKPATNVLAQRVNEMIRLLDWITLLEQVRMDLMKSHRIDAMNYTTQVIEDLYRSLQALQEVC